MPSKKLLPFLLLFVLSACNSIAPQSKSDQKKQYQVMASFKQAERQFKSGAPQQVYPFLVTELNAAIAELPTNTPPRVIDLLKGSTSAYTSAYRYWRCDDRPPGDDRATCRDRELEKVIVRFPYIKRNITTRLLTRQNPPIYISSSITTQNVLQLLLMQAELNRVDAHLILTGGSYDGVYEEEA